MTPPAPPAPPRPAMEIVAPFGRTWDAVIDEFAAQNIPIRTMERASGFIATEQLSVPRTTEKLADCGTDVGVALIPHRATYNVLVRGDSTRSTVKVTVRWTSGGLTYDNVTAPIECSTTGLWETRAETAIKERAEGTRR
jgi:hypothetical protein